MVILLSGAVALAALLSTPALAPGTYIWNFTSSIPIGLYRIDRGTWKEGDLVAVRPVGKLKDVLAAAGVLKDGRLLLKRVAAIAGEEVCRAERAVSINGVRAAVAREKSGADNDLFGWSGCRTLNDDEVLLLGDSANSFDGRYFGPARADQIVGRITPILAF